jgi:two-component system response regulator MprA
VLRTRVLVVEDLAVLRRAYREILERAGYEVSVASNGGAALAMLDVTRPDVVVAEVAMPVMDGITLMRTMRQRGVSARVLMLADDEFLRGLALHAGAEQFLAQPITPDDLIDAVAVLARSYPALRRDSA